MRDRFFALCLPAAGGYEIFFHGVGGASCRIGLVSFYGLDVLTSRLEVALSGEDPSGLVRWEIWKTALSAIGLSPFWGTGFGAFRYLSPLFEPSYAPGTISFNVHNDFMELAVVLGIPCALLVLGWLAYLFWRNARGVLAAPRSSLHFCGGRRDGGSAGDSWA